MVFATLILPEVSHAEYPRFHHLREADQDSKASWLEISKQVYENYNDENNRMKQILRKYLGRSNNPMAGCFFTMTNKRWKVDGFEFDLPWKMISFGYRSRFLFDIYERKERDLVKEFIDEDDLVLELGACIGVVSCEINRQLKGNRDKHVAVEPNAAMIPLLVGNGIRNGAGYTTLYGTVSKRKESFFLAGRSISLGRTTLERGAVGVQVPGFSLEELNDKYGNFNVMVCDIEGAESELLRENFESLRQFRLIIIEQHDAVIGTKAANECRRLLESSGLRLGKAVGKAEAWLRD